MLYYKHRERLLNTRQTLLNKTYEGIRKGKGIHNMKKTQEIKMSYQGFSIKEMNDKYYDGDADYLDESFVSKEMKMGLGDCMKYIESNVVDDEVIWIMNNANSGAFYREPFQGQYSFSNTYE